MRQENRGEVFWLAGLIKTSSYRASPRVQTQTISQHLQAAITGHFLLNLGYGMPINRSYGEQTGILKSLMLPPWSYSLAKPGQVFKGMSSDTFPMQKMP